MSASFHQLIFSIYSVFTIYCCSSQIVLYLHSVMFSSFGAGQSGADFSARKNGLEAAARLFAISDGVVDDDDDPLSEKGSKPDINGSVVFKGRQITT